MSKTVLTNASLVVDGTDLSRRASQVAIDTSTDEVDLSAFQSEFKDTGVGLKEANIQATFFQDFAAGEVDDVLWPLINANEVFSVEVKADKAPKSATNPLFKLAEARLFNYSPISGSVGQASTTQVTFKNASDTKGIERITE